MAGHRALDKLLLKARFEALLEHASPNLFRKLERALAAIETSLRPSRRRGRPSLPPGTLKDLKLNADLQKLLGGGRTTDKEAIERLVDVARPKNNMNTAEVRRRLVKLWRSRLASARKK
jgi:hypothetical protein